MKEENEMKKLSINAARAIIGGRTYSYLFCHRYSGSCRKVNAHSLKYSYFGSTVFQPGWTTAFRLLKAGLGG